MTPDAPADGWALREARLRLGLTQTQLAARLGVDAMTVSRMERRGADDPRLRLALVGLEVLIWREAMGRIAALTLARAREMEPSRKRAAARRRRRAARRRLVELLQLRAGAIRTMESNDG